jgi:hypothetical protein
MMIMRPAQNGGLQSSMLPAWALGGSPQPHHHCHLSELRQCPTHFLSQVCFLVSYTVKLENEGQWYSQWLLSIKLYYLLSEFFLSIWFTHKLHLVRGSLQDYIWKTKGLQVYFYVMKKEFNRQMKLNYTSQHLTTEIQNSGGWEYSWGWRISVPTLDSNAGLHPLGSVWNYNMTHYWI